MPPNQIALINFFWPFKHLQSCLHHHFTGYSLLYIFLKTKHSKIKAATPVFITVDLDLTGVHFRLILFCQFYQKYHLLTLNFQFTNFIQCYFNNFHLCLCYFHLSLNPINFLIFHSTNFIKIYFFLLSQSHSNWIAHNFPIFQKNFFD